MNKLDRQKRALLLLMAYIIIIFTPKLKKKQNIITYNNNYQVTENMEFATYDGYHIYIGSNKLISQIYDDNPYNIYIIDGRNNDNPNIEICDSTKIKDHKQILEILLEYERRYPTEWDRTIHSMENEWYIHNLCYFLGLEIARTSEVDLDNDDEANYQNILTIIKAFLNDELYQKETEKFTLKLTK